MLSAHSIEMLQSNLPTGYLGGGKFDYFESAKRKRKSDKVRIGLLVPYSGSDAIWGPSCQYSAVLASARINAAGGILGKEIELFAADAGGTPDHVIPRVNELVEKHQVDALVGVHLSNVRVAIQDRFASEIPYVFAPQYEGGESAPGVIAIGETPIQQYGGAVRWMIQNMGARKWYLLGNDYVWPRQTHRTLKVLIREAGGEIVGEDYLPLASTGHANSLNRIREAAPDIVFESLVGSDSVTFNQEFGVAGFSEKIMRLSGAIEENTLMGISADNSHNLFCVSGYFNTLGTVENRAFLNEYHKAFGDTAPIQGSLSQSCYEGLFALTSLATKVGSLKSQKIMATSKNFSYQGARGEVRIHSDGTHMDSYLMQSNGLEYELIQTFPMI
ncbi:MAG: substrate-binding domain-containing protein [Rhizobiaceae bacterium]|nr:substrate-binding domain-containing protein [Rhizobiaceae bacterium]